ncbi:SUMF1/EgtB/PvdO family nonheme iron enzyme [Deltaproteobacteria bacterium TL4]
MSNDHLLSGVYLLSVRKALYLPVENQRVVIEDEGKLQQSFTLDPNFGEIRVEAEPRGTQIVVAPCFVTGKESGGATKCETDNSPAAKRGATETSPATLRLEPGDYQFKLRKDGYAPLEFKVSVARNKKQMISATEATLRKLEGFVMVSSKPYIEGASVFVDGEDQGEVPAQLTLAAGAHEIEVRQDGKAGKETITLKDGQTLTLELELKEQASGDFVLVKGGCFQMGDIFGEGGSDEKPVHKVCLDDFYLGKTEVTQGQWQKVMGNNPSNFKNGDNYPVEQVSWNDIQIFLQRLNQQGGKYRLPTEAEWEYASRSGGKRERYSGSDSIDGVAWYDGNSGNQTHAVGTKAPNGLGLYDMTGNVWEWVQDWYGENYYSQSPSTNPRGPSNGSYRVYRGGSWYYFAGYSRSANRYYDSPDCRYHYFGFRFAFSPGQ